MKAGLALVGLLTSCVSVDFSRVRIEAPIADDRFAGLQPGTANLSDCLARLGAPHLVREHRGGSLLVWVWSDSFSWGADVSYAISDFEVSVSWDDTSADIEGLALLFDRELVLQRVKRALLRDLVPTDRRRPQTIAVQTCTARLYRFPAQFPVAVRSRTRQRHQSGPIRPSG